MSEKTGTLGFIEALSRSVIPSIYLEDHETWSRKILEVAI